MGDGNKFVEEAGWLLGTFGDYFIDIPTSLRGVLEKPFPVFFL